MNLFIISISTILLIIDIYIYQRNKKLFDRKIKNNNKILFVELRKKYLNNVSNEDIKDLISFLYKYMKEREKKTNGNKKSSK